MKLRKWLNDLLIIITIGAVIVASGECDNTRIFVLKTVISLFVIILNSMILLKYGRN